MVPVLVCRVGWRATNPPSWSFGPAVDRHAVFPHAEEQPPAADLVGGDPIRQHDGCGRMRPKDQPVQPVEERPMLGGDAVDIAADLRVYPHATFIAGSIETISRSRHGSLPSPAPALCRADGRAGRKSSLATYQHVVLMQVVGVRGGCPEQ
jgi:hypothetical protein